MTAKLIIMFLPCKEIQFEDETIWAYEYGFIEDGMEHYAQSFSPYSKKIGAYLKTTISGYINLEDRIR